MRGMGEREGCGLCPRLCGADRAGGEKGVCGADGRIMVARAALHMWEEPCISGERGSGAVFFCGCPLHCVFCQNHEISSGMAGKEITKEQLSRIFLSLQDQGAANLNLVTASHYVPQILEALSQAWKEGFRLPVVYNSSAYEQLKTLAMLDGAVDVYLPDLKYMDPALAGSFSHAPDYPGTAMAAIEEMVKQTGPCVFDAEGYIIRGTIVRHLILPGHTRDSMAVLDYLFHTYGKDIYISIMSQYTPVRHQSRYPELNRRLTQREYRKVLDHAQTLGIENGYYQEGSTAQESFIPAFDLEGL